MIPITIFGDDCDNTLGNMMKAALSPYGDVIYQTSQQGEINTQKANCDFFIEELAQLPFEPDGKGIAVFKKSFMPQTQLQLPKGWVAVVGSHHDKLKEQFCKTGQVVITCGTKVTDTLSIASLDENQTAISLQRTLKAMNGEVIEPCELTMHLTQPYSPHKILPVAAVLLLAGIPWDSIFIL